MGPEQENREGGTVESHPPDAHWLAMAVSPGIIASDCPAYPTLAYILYSYCDSEELCIAPTPTPGKDVTTVRLVHMAETLLPEQVSGLDCLNEALCSPTEKVSSESVDKLGYFVAYSCSYTPGFTWTSSIYLERSLFLC